MRILTPSDYGLLAMATALIAFLDLFSELGLGWAVVNAKKRDVDVLTLRKVFGLILVVHGAMFAFVLLAAPAIAEFFGEARLTVIIRVIGIQFLLVAPSVIPNAMLQRKLEFKWRSIISFAVTIVSAFVTLGLAIHGFGVWSLVLGTLTSAALSTTAINVLSPFLHMPMLAFKGLGKLFKFGGYVAASRVLLYLYLQADMILGGRLLGKEQIGYYSVGMHLASLPMQRVSAILNEVAFPAFASMQDDLERVAYHVLQAIRLTSLCSFPVFWGIGAVAPEIVDVLLGAKWAPSILPLQLMAIVMPLRMIAQLMPPTLQGVGNAKLTARNQLLTCGTMIAAFAIGVQYGIVGLSVAWLAAFPITFLVNLTTWLPALGIQASRVFAAIARPAAASAGMFALVGLARALGVGHGATALLTLVAIGAVGFVGLSLIVNRDELREAFSMVRRRSGS